MISASYTVDQTVLRWPEVHRLAGDMQSGKFGYYNLYTSLNLPFENGYTAAATIGMMLFSYADRARMPLDLVQKRASEVIYYALTSLARDPAAWSPSTLEPGAQLADPVPQAGKPACLRSLQEAFGIQERAARPIIAYVDSQKVITAKSAEEVLSQSTFCSMVDGEKVACELKAAFPGALFASRYQDSKRVAFVV